MSVRSPTPCATKLNGSRQTELQPRCHHCRLLAPRHKLFADRPFWDKVLETRRRSRRSGLRTKQDSLYVLCIQTFPGHGAKYHLLHSSLIVHQVTLCLLLLFLTSLTDIEL